MLDFVFIGRILDTKLKLNCLTFMWVECKKLKNMSTKKHWSVGKRATDCVTPHER